MKYLMSAALVVALLGGASALAQPGPDDHRDRGGQGGERAPRNGENPAPRAPQAAPAPRPVQAPQPNDRGYRGAPPSRENGPMNPGQPPARGDPGAPGGGARYPGVQRGSGADQAIRAAPRNVPSTYRPRFGAPEARPGADRPRYNPQYFPRVFTPDRRYAWRGGDWRGQPGYYYRHWGYGDRLPFGWFDARWYIDDYYYYDLPVPPDGYEWVRVGPDALLVDLDDGEVVESVYGLFD